MIQTDSRQALALFESNSDQFDMVITDQTMPGLTGLELSVALLQVKPDLPIILCTGYSNNASEERAKKIGIKAFLKKPLVLSHLAQTTRSLLDAMNG
jgi:CheY-like chemotaxis protein